MTNPVSNSSAIYAQGLEERKKVTWGNTTVVVIEPTYNIPKDCSKANEECLIQLMNARDELRQALSQPKSGLKKAHVMTVLGNIISRTEGELDPISRTINQVSHVLLARTYMGMFYGAYLKEKKLIDADPEMQKKNDNWQQLLTAESFFT